MRTAKYMAGKMEDRICFDDGEFCGFNHKSATNDLEEWHREILTEAAERAWEWFTGKSKEDNYPATPDQLRRAVMGEE